MVSRLECCRIDLVLFDFRQIRCLWQLLLIIIVVAHIVRLELRVCDCSRASVLLKSIIVMIVLLWLISYSCTTGIRVDWGLIWLRWRLWRDSLTALVCFFSSRKLSEMWIDITCLKNMIEYMRFIFVRSNISRRISRNLPSIDTHSPISRLCSINIISP